MPEISAVLREVVSVQPLSGHRLRLTFDDGVEGVVDVAQMVQFTGVFEPLRAPAFFDQVKVNAELGKVQWPNDADLDTDVLYAKVTGIPIRQERADLHASLDRALEDSDAGRAMEAWEYLKRYRIGRKDRSPR